jgi:hypothetical protein
MHPENTMARSACGDGSTKMSTLQFENFVRTRVAGRRLISGLLCRSGVREQLHGPHGRTLQVVTIWITLDATGATRLVTLDPDREARQ